MSTLLAVCFAAATAAEIAIAIVAIRALYRFNRVATGLEQSARALGDCASQIQMTGREVQELVASLRDVVPPVRRAAESFGRVGERAADLGSTVLNEFEGPVRRTLDLFRCVQAGASYFLNRAVHVDPAAANGGHSDE